jgi:glycerol-3-phosphate dehydrogenase
VDQPGSNCDILVVGGGVNGAGIARDAAGRGHKVLLVERGDLAQATSSASSKLIHGGLRYLENYQFRLVREALAEREVLLRMAPHIIWPMRFVLPHRPEMRPRWMIRAGLFLYDHLARRVRAPAQQRRAERPRADLAPLRGGGGGRRGGGGCSCRRSWARHREKRQWQREVQSSSICCV